MASKEDMKMWFGEFQAQFMAKTETQFESMKNEMKKAIQELGSEIKSLGERMDTLEKITQNLDEEMQQYAELQEQLLRRTHNLEIQCEDLENRSRRSNIRIKNMVESIDDRDLKTAVQQVFKEILAAKEEEEVSIDKRYMEVASEDAPANQVDSKVVTSLN
ncbi:uncharacterized protein [Ambystoma mexicanum]|uniref:uncharacterized protein n=1 Tax=Ambystoma mexicanum TaxID=8296 RepID=UPI0037E7BCEA